MKTENKIITYTAEYFKIKPEDITGQIRKKEFVEARAYCAMALRTIMAISLVTVGKILGGRDHSTVVNLIDRELDNPGYWKMLSNRLEIKENVKLAKYRKRFTPTLKENERKKLEEEFNQHKKDFLDYIKETLNRYKGRTLNETLINKIIN